MEGHGGRREPGARGKTEGKFQGVARSYDHGHREGEVDADRGDASKLLAGNGEVDFAAPTPVEPADPRLAPEGCLLGVGGAERKEKRAVRGLPIIRQVGTGEVGSAESDGELRAARSAKGPVIGTATERRSAEEAATHPRPRSVQADVDLAGPCRPRAGEIAFASSGCGSRHPPVDGNEQPLPKANLKAEVCPVPHRSNRRRA